MGVGMNIINGKITKRAFSKCGNQKQKSKIEGSASKKKKQKKKKKMRAREKNRVSELYATLSLSVPLSLSLCAWNLSTRLQGNLVPLALELVSVLVSA